jgi:acyl-coenzyme A thioesterase PaaI-like protein
MQQEMMASLTKSGINKNNPHEVAEFIKQNLESNKLKSIEIVNKKGKTKLKLSEESDAQEGIVSAAAVVAAAAVALAVVVWSVAAVVEGVVFWTTEVNETNGGYDNLLQEQMVNSIVENLK